MATAYKGLVIELGADTSKLKSAMREVNTAAKGTQTELNQIRSALKFDPGNVKLLAQQTAQLGNRVEETKDKLRVLKAQLASMDESKVGTDEWDKLQREIIKTEGQLDSYKRALKQSEQAQKAAQSSLGQLGHKLQDVADDYKEVGDSMKSVGTGMTAGITAPVAAAGTAVMATAVQFDDAFAKMKAACQGNEEQAKKLLEVGRNLYNGGWGESVEQITDALIKTRAVLRDVSDEDLEIVTQSAIMLEDTFGSDMTESVRGINVLMKKFGLSAQEACDLLVAGTQRGLDYTDELGDNLSEYGGRWAEAGMSASQYFSLLEAGTASGAYNLDKVGDFLNEFLTSLSDGRMEEGIGQFSKGTQEVFNSFREGKATAQDVLNAVIGDMQTMTSETDRAAIASTLWSSLGEDNAMGMILALGGVNDSFADVAGAASGAADAMSENLGSRAKSALRELQDAFQPFAEKGVEALKGVADMAKGVADWFSGLDPAAQNAVLGIAAFLAAIGPVLVIVGTLLGSLQTIGTALVSLGGFFSGAGIAAGGMGASVAAIAAPVAAVVAVIAAVAAAVVYLWSTSEGFRNTVIGAWDAISAKVQEIGAFLQPYVQQFMAVVEQTVSTVIQNLMPIIDGILQFLITVAVPVIENILEVVGNVLGAILQTVTSIMQGVQQVIDGVLNVIKGIFQTVLGLIHGIVTGDFTQMQNGISTIMNGISSIISGVWNAIMGVVSGVVNTILSVVQGAWNNITAITSGVFNGIKNTIDSVMGGAKNIVSDALGAIANFFSNCKLELPKIKLPHFSIQGSFSLNPPSIPYIGVDWYAKGGIINRPSVIGVGEAGAEAVMPLSKLPELMAEALSMLGGGAGGGATVVVENMNVRNESDVRAMAQELYRLGNRAARAKGRVYA